MTEPGRLFSQALCDIVGRDALTTRLSEEFVLADLGEDAVRALFTLEDLNHVLATCAPEPPRLRLHREGSPVPLDRYTEVGTASRDTRRVVRPESLYRELRTGASLVLDGVDRMHPGVGAAADDLMRLVHERAQANLYLIWGESRGFDTHWDDHDTMIVQLAGSKHWRVHGPGTRPFPMKNDTDHAHTPPRDADGALHQVWEGVLRPGQVIHVPRGWWHTVTGNGEMSMHLTFGFTRATGIDWAETLVRRLFEEETFRRDLPRFADADARRKHRHALAARLAELAEDADLDAFLSERDARFPRRTSFSLPWPVEDRVPDADTRVEFVPILPPPVEREGDKVAVTVAGKRYRLPVVTEPVLETLAEHRALTVAELTARAGVEADLCARVVAALSRHHLVLLR
ncbi:JmjC domain-containing protein [Nocardiopsis sp. MG754419]|uniref:JmjC domain-containing protein n=1 Tax=Nocardiopsis sp. MG754419 TaxID=2259865 RepID=UPI001BA7B3FF|nr:cupin domain-containing protein [Nocardiopsis sp. MG754419]MBR8742124.1 cupin [Nocardiopsis sp. MG754419]